MVRKSLLHTFVGLPLPGANGHNRYVALSLGGLLPGRVLDDLQLVLDRHAQEVEELGKLTICRKAIPKTSSSSPHPNPNPKPKRTLTGVTKARHEGILSHSQLRLVNGLVPGGLGWSTANLRLEEALLIPQVD